MKHIFNSDYLSENLSYILEIGKEFFGTKKGLHELKPIILYLLNSDNITTEMIIDSAKTISEKEGKIAMTAAEVLRKEGLEQGLTKGKLEDATKMIAKGFSIKDIIEITGLSEEQIKGL